MTSEDKQFFFNVVGGPNKFDLMLSLFDGNKRPRRTVGFQLEGVSRHIRIAITSVQQEDGSGESWNFGGHLWHDTEKHWHVEGYFGTKDRRGTMHFVTPTNRWWNDEDQKFMETVNQQEFARLQLYVAELKASGVV
jgi:hypothetical protein